MTQIFCNSNIELTYMLLLFLGKTLTYAVPVIHSLQSITPKISVSD